MKRTPLRSKSLTTKTSTKKARKRRRSKRSVKSKLDQMARAYVMERDHYQCRMAGVGLAGLRCTPQIQWCHIKSRRYLSTRWLPANSLAGCVAHHRWSHDNPDEFIDWWKSTYPERADEIKGAFDLGVAPTPEEVEAMLK